MTYLVLLYITITENFVLHMLNITRDTPPRKPCPASCPCALKECLIKISYARCQLNTILFF